MYCRLNYLNFILCSSNTPISQCISLRTLFKTFNSSCHKATRSQLDSILHPFENRSLQNNDTWKAQCTHRSQTVQQQTFRKLHSSKCAWTFNSKTFQVNQAINQSGRQHPSELLRQPVLPLQSSPDSASPLSATTCSRVRDSGESVN